MRCATGLQEDVETYGRTMWRGRETGHNQDWHKRKSKCGYKRKSHEERDNSTGGNMVMNVRRDRAIRPGFTLVEMLVSMALVLFIMVILTTAFSAGLDTFRQLKAVGTLQEKLRVVTNVLRRDLNADHFDTRRRLSDPNFFFYGPPREGFFRIVQGAGSQSEGTDGDGNPSVMANTHGLNFTVKLRGNRREDFFTAVIGDSSSPLFNEASTPTNFFGQSDDGRFQDGTATYSNAWGELAYFLFPTGTTTNLADPNFGSGTPLFALYRSQLVMVPRNDKLQSPTKMGTFSNYLSMSAEFFSKTNNPNNTLFFNNPSDVVPVQDSKNLTHRGWGQFGIGSPNTGPNPIFEPSPNSGPQPGYRIANAGDATFTMDHPENWGATLLLTDVISFDVRILKSSSVSAGNVSDLVDVDNGVFDTGSNPLPTYTIAAIEITVRVWDPKSSQARQMTIVQDL